jgi:hypothetical protein
MRIFSLLGATSALAMGSVLFVGDVAKADKANLMTCIKEYTTLGISPDAALGECKKTTLANCMQELLGKKYEAVAIKYVAPGTPQAKEGETGFLIDLGNTESRWLEGKQWKERSCFAYTQGPYKRQSDRNSTFWSTQRSYEWFRQGYCETDKITLEQPYSMEEAKLRCEVGVIQAPVVADPKKEPTSKK